MAVDLLFKEDVPVSGDELIGAEDAWVPHEGPANGFCVVDAAIDAVLSGGDAVCDLLKYHLSDLGGEIRPSRWHGDWTTLERIREEWLGPRGRNNEVKCVCRLYMKTG